MNNKLLAMGIMLMFLIVGFSGCVENKPITVTFSASKDTGYQPFEVTFNVMVSESGNTIKSNKIFFGDGNETSFSGGTIKHIYNSPGEFFPNVTIIDEQNNVVRENLTITVKNKQPTVSVSRNADSGKVPLTVNFTSYADDLDGSIVSYNWDFGDGCKSNLENPSHTFNNTGIFIVKLEVTDDDGGTSETSFTISVKGNEPPVAVISYDDEDTFTYEFDGRESYDSDGKIKSYEWDFGDGIHITGFDRTNHKYDSIGTYTVTLSVTDDEGAVGFKTITINLGDADDDGGYDGKVESSFELNPIDDAYVDSSLPNSKLGDIDSNDLKVWVCGSAERFIYLKFDLSDIPTSANIENVELSLYCYDIMLMGEDTVPNVNLYACSDSSWDEDTITYNNAPDYDENYLDIITVGDSMNYWRDHDLNNYIENHLGETVTFVLGVKYLEDYMYGNCVTVLFYPKEFSKYYQPELTVILNK